MQKKKLILHIEVMPMKTALQRNHECSAPGQALKRRLELVIPDTFHQHIFSSVLCGGTPFTFEDDRRSWEKESWCQFTASHFFVWQSATHVQRLTHTPESSAPILILYVVQKLHANRDETKVLGLNTTSKNGKENVGYAGSTTVLYLNLSVTTHYLVVLVMDLL